MKIFFWLAGLMGVAGIGTSIFYLVDRTVDSGTFQGRKWRVRRKGYGAFCAEIESPIGFGAEPFGALSCHETVGQARGEAILALTNLDEGTDSTPLGPLIGATAVPGFDLYGMKQQLQGLPPLPPMPGG